MNYFDMNRVFLNERLVGKDYASDIIMCMYDYVSPSLSEYDELHTLVNGGRTELLKKEGGSLAFILGMLSSVTYEKEQKGETFIQWKRRNKIDNIL